MEKKFTLKLLSAIAMEGVVHHPSDENQGLVDVNERSAKDLLRRGKARIPTDKELRAAGRDVPGDSDEAGGDEAPAKKAGKTGAK